MGTLSIFVTPDASEARIAGPYLVSNAVYRTCHVLSGSSKMAQMRHGVQSAELSDHWLLRACVVGMGLSSPSVSTSGRAPPSTSGRSLRCLREVAHALNERIAEDGRAGRGALAVEVNKPSAADRHTVRLTIQFAEPHAKASQPDIGQEEPQGHDLEGVATITEEVPEFVDTPELALGDWQNKLGSADDTRAIRPAVASLAGVTGIPRRFCLATARPGTVAEQPGGGRAYRQQRPDKDELEPPRGSELSHSLR